MKINIVGAAGGEVTGSAYYVQTKHRQGLDGGEHEGLENDISVETLKLSEPRGPLIAKFYTFLNTNRKHDLIAGLSLALVFMGLVLGGRPAQGANVELDSPSTPAGYVALLLINEVPFPGERAYISEEDSKAAMLSVLWVLHCRVAAIPPGYTQKQVADVQTSNVIDVMTAGGVKGQVDGFYKDSDGRPVAVPRVHERVAYLLGLANRGQPGKMASLLAYARDLARRYFQTGPAAKDIFAELRKIGSKRVTGRGYAWMTDARGCDPGGAFVPIPDNDQGALGGNRFYTLEKRK